MESQFTRLYRDATHELYVGTSLKQSELAHQLAPRKRLLYRRQSDFRLPGMEADAVAMRVGIHLVQFLINTGNPRRVLGMYELMREGDQAKCPWEVELNKLRRDLLKSQLRRMGISLDSFLEEPELYLSLGTVASREKEED